MEDTATRNIQSLFETELDDLAGNNEVIELTELTEQMIVQILINIKYECYYEKRDQ